MLLLKARRRLALFAIRLIQRLRIAFNAALSTNRIDGRPVLHQPVQAVGCGVIRCGNNVRIGAFPSPGFLDGYAYIEARRPSACITIGSGTWINNGFRCVAEHSSISIGPNCLIGTNVEILDSDFHGVRLQDRNQSKAEWAAPVTVESDVFIGSNVRILKGVRIGSGAVIANSSLVVTDIPARVVAGGVPAKTLRVLE